MGKVLLYGAGKACLAMQCAPTTETDGYSTNPFKVLNGTQYNSMYYYTYSTSNYQSMMPSFQIYNGLTGYASADTEDDFSLEHYTTREISNVSYVRTATAERGGRVYSIRVTNNNSESVSVGSIKFTKSIACPAKSSTGKDALILGYFFDSAVTINPGESKTFAIEFNP